MRYEFLPEIYGIRESTEISPLVRQLERGVTLEGHEMMRETAEPVEVAENIGNPEKDMENWHMQTASNSCAIACQEFVAEQLLHRDFSEEDMARYATEQGWYRPESGTPEGHVGDILESLGLEVSKEKGQTLFDLAEDIRQGGKVICSVNNMVLDNPDFAELPGLQANHVVEVIGIDAARPGGAQVILNDSGVENGRGRQVSADTFVKAWNTGRNFAVTAWKEE